MTTRTPENGNAMREAALALLGLGWSVIPVEARGKRPIVPWLEYQSRMPRRDEVENWFKARRALNLAIVTGAVSNLVVLDVDPGHGGTEALAALERSHGPLPETVEARSGGGGRHFYFTHPGTVVHNRIGLAAGIDLRGDGGCIVAPPSVHASGQRYQWLPRRSPLERNTSPLPPWLLRLLRPPGEASGHPLSHWRQLVREGVGQGRRNSTLASLTGHLLWHGVDPLVALELLLAWNRVRCRPPLADEEVAGVIDSIARLHERGAG